MLTIMNDLISLFSLEQDHKMSMLLGFHVTKVMMRHKLSTELVNPGIFIGRMNVPGSSLGS